MLFRSLCDATLLSFIVLRYKNKLTKYKLAHNFLLYNHDCFSCSYEFYTELQEAIIEGYRKFMQINFLEENLKTKCPPFYYEIERRRILFSKCKKFTFEDINSSSLLAKY